MAHIIKPIPSKRIKDQTGKKQGRLTVVGFLGLNWQHSATWLCRCECGGETVTTTGELNRGGERGPTMSCGCLQRESAAETFTTHGMTGTPEHAAWCDMKSRCTNPNAGEWKRYGARGIAVCDRWLHSFDVFLADMGPRPSPDHSLDREDSDGNYEPSNCRWATKKEQQRNRRCTSYVEYQGEKLPLAELAERVGISRHALKGRLRKGMSIEDAIAA